MMKLMLAAVSLMVLAVPGRAQISIQPGGSLRIEGDSSLHKWSSTATVVAMTFQVAQGGPPSLSEAIKASQVADLEVKIAVAGLKSGESGLDKNLRKAMNEKQFPDIVYHLDHYELTPGQDQRALTAKTQGTLTVNGKTRPVTMDVEFTLGSGAPEVKGHYALKMSDFGVKPPTLMMGAIKTRDPVTVRFDLLLQTQGKPQ